MVVKIMVPFGVLSIIRHLVFSDPKRDQSFDNHPHGCFYTLGGPLKGAVGLLARGSGVDIRLVQTGS